MTQELNEQDLLLTKEQVIEAITKKFYGFDPEIDIDFEAIELTNQAQLAKAIPILLAKGAERERERIIKWVEDGRSEWNRVPEAGGCCLCIYESFWQALKEGEL